MGWGFKGWEKVPGCRGFHQKGPENKLLPYTDMFPYCEDFQKGTLICWKPPFDQEDLQLGVYKFRRKRRT